MLRRGSREAIRTSLLLKPDVVNINRNRGLFLCREDSASLSLEVVLTGMLSTVTNAVYLISLTPG